ncbi:MAG: hypothetical protein AAF915_06050 [Cyanobacteria bacterium P01_D01_bin.50]
MPIKSSRAGRWLKSGKAVIWKNKFNVFAVFNLHLMRITIHSHFWLVLTQLNCLLWDSLVRNYELKYL